MTGDCSGDEKYKLQKDGKDLLRRIGDKSKASLKKKEYDRLSADTATDINTHKPVGFAAF